MKYQIFVITILLINLLSCNNNNPEQIIYKKYDNIINVKDQIVDIKTDLVFGKAELRIIDSFLVIHEYTPAKSKGVHLLNKNSFEYITSTAIVGKGPGEVNRQGGIEYEAKGKNLWISDHGKMVLWKFPLDSILNNNQFKPSEKIALNPSLFINRYNFLNDSIALGKAVSINSNNSFEVKTAKLNVNTNVIAEFGYEHPDASGEKSHSYFALSKKHNIYVCTYTRCDLMTICDLSGNLKFNIFGPDWGKSKGDEKEYFSPAGVEIANDFIIAAYLDAAGVVMDKNQRLTGNLPTKFLVFDINGNYIQTIETGHKIIRFCIDKENDRVIAYFNDRLNPLGYFNLNLQTK